MSENLSPFTRIVLIPLWSGVFSHGEIGPLRYRVHQRRGHLLRRSRDIRQSRCSRLNQGELQVIIENAEPKRVNEILLELKGRARTYWTKHSGKSRKHCSHSEPYFLEQFNTAYTEKYSASGNPLVSSQLFQRFSKIAFAGATIARGPARSALLVHLAEVVTLLLRGRIRSRPLHVQGNL